MRIGAHALSNGLFVAPMAGITDRPFRRLAVRSLPGGEAFRSSVNRLHAADAQRAAVNDYFQRLAA